jgi:hypothetical protein
MSFSDPDGNGWLVQEVRRPDNEAKAGDQMTAATR